MPTIQVFNAGHQCLARSDHALEVSLFYENAYQAGDYLLITLEDDCRFGAVKVDQAMAEAVVYMPLGRMAYRIEQGEGRLAFPPQAFEGTRHVITARTCAAAEQKVYRNVALNPVDQRGDVECYPHATANVETRGEAVFAARNVIDGMRLNDSHGEWPFQSWGIGARTDAYLTVDFGRPVVIDAMALTLRADFPHDAYWTQATVVLSDGTEKTFPLQQVAERQRVELGAHTVTWMRLEQLQKSDDPSAFPALTEWEIYGRDA